jgi:hypothetical protein
MEFERAHSKIRQLELHYEKDGRKYSAEDREWVISDLFIPCDDRAFKLWPRNLETFDPKFTGQVGMVVEWTPELVTEWAAYEEKHPGEGLGLFPIMVVVHNLQRGAGKTVSVAGMNLMDLAMEEEWKVSFVASAYKQSKMLLTENYIEPISRSKKLSAGFSMTGDRLTFERKGGRSSYLEMTETSHASITGRRRHRVVIDEARDVEGRTFAAVLPTIRAGAKFRCKHGHKVETYRPDVVMHCPTCKDVLYPRIPKLVISSTSGVLDSSEHDWFMELVEALEKEPNAYSHLYRDDNAANPALAKVEHDMLSGVFGNINSIATYVDVELNNNPRRKGQDFVSPAQFEAVIDKRLANMEASDAHCFGFLDTSRVGDLTSLVIVANDNERDKFPNARPDAFRYVKTEHIKMWNPKDPRDCPKGYVDRNDIQDYLADILWKFPNLIELQVDVRGTMAWAVDMVMDIRSGRVQRIKPMRFKIKSMMNLQGDERNTAWAKLEDRIISGTWRTFEHKRLKEEILAVRKTITVNGKVEIKDRNRKVKHADVLEGFAQNMYRIHKYIVTPRASFGSANASGGIQRALKDIFGSSGESNVSASSITERDF